MKKLCHIVGDKPRLVRDAYRCAVTAKKLSSMFCLHRPRSSDDSAARSAGTSGALRALAKRSHHEVQLIEQRKGYAQRDADRFTNEVNAALFVSFESFADAAGNQRYVLT